MLDVVGIAAVVAALFLGGDSSDTSSVETVAMWADIVKSVTEVVAILVGGWWAYQKFIRQREEWPKATLEHHLQHLDLPDGKKVLRATERISNSGSVLLELLERTTRVQQILPIDDIPLASLKANSQEADWLELACHRLADPDRRALIEPGESDEFVHDFLIDEDVKVVQVYSYFKNVKRKDRDIGWGLTTIYDLGQDDGTHSKATNLRGREDGEQEGGSATAEASAHDQAAGT